MKNANSYFSIFTFFVLYENDCAVLPSLQWLGFKRLVDLLLRPWPVGISVPPDKGSVAAAKGSSN